MELPIITTDIIVFSDGFVWKILSKETAERLWNLDMNDFEMFWVRTYDESEASIESLDQINRAFECGDYVCIEVGQLSQKQ
jgi:hypothetical protein|nr:MAG TPA: hypothetical protein [Caudoviricetes sp.]